MINKHGKLKFLSIAAAVLATLLLGTLQTGSPDSFTNPVFVAQPDGTGLKAPDGKPDATAVPGDAPLNIIKDIENLNHPVKTVLQSEGVKILSLELLKDGKYPIFYVTFPFELSYENESRLTGILDKAARANLWWDFELVENDTGTRIKVTCDRQFNMVDEVMINGDRNYFIKLAQQKAVRNYSYISPIDLKPAGKMLKTLAEGGWKRDKLQELLGDSDSFFDGYEIYFDRGISVKYSGGRVYNIVFNNRYKDAVLKGLDFGGGRQKVVELLGQPQFEAAGQELYGYKTESCYIFFTGIEKLREISIYSRNTGYGRDTLAKLLEKYGRESGKFDLYSFIEELKTKWPEYDLYYNERGGLGISYDSIGISADNMYEDRGGPYITVYANFEGAIDSSLELPGKAEGLVDYSNELLQLQLDTDSIFAAEQGRLERIKYLDGRRQEQGAVSPDGTMKVVDNDAGTYEHAGLFIFSMDGARPDTELNTGHFAGKVIWLDNRYFIYDVSMLGIFLYDVRDEKADGILPSNLEKNEDYELESYEGGIITIKNLANNNMLTRRCVFTSDGTVSIER